MLVGMVALRPVWSLALPGLTDLPDAHALVMATNMAAGMALCLMLPLMLAAMLWRRGDYHH
jgi:hypothetical protein